MAGERPTFETAATVLVILVAAAIQLARIVQVPSPLGPNDRSRWATIAALIETGDYSIGERTMNADGTYRDARAPVNIDILLDPSTKRFYSSKPPLLPTLIAGEFIALRAVLGWESSTHGPYFLRTILATFNGVPVVALLFLLAATLALIRGDPRTKLLLVAVAAFGTFATTFVTTVTNHVPAVAGCALALYAAARIFVADDNRARWYVLAGLGAGWTASQEIPAAWLVVLLGLVFARKDMRAAAMYFLPACLVPLGAFWLTNALALGDPFFFYAPDAAWSKFEGSYWASQVGRAEREPSHLAYLFHFVAGHHGVISLSPWVWFAFAGMAHEARDAERPHGWALAGTVGFVLLCFVLRLLHKSVGVPMPLLLLAPVALALWITHRGRERPFSSLPLAATLPVVAFYLVRTSNYGGVTAGPRWLIWLVPLWIVATVPVVDRALEKRSTTMLLLFAVAASVFAASYVGINPWSDPWLYDLVAPPPTPRP